MTELRKAEEYLTSIAGEIPLLEKTDLSPLNGVMVKLTELPSVAKLPAAFVSQIERTVSLIENIIIGEVDFANGVKKLGQSIEKMLKEAGNPQRKKEEPAEPGKEEAPVAAVREAPVKADEPAAPSPFEGDQSLLVDFVNEARDHIHTAETLLLELETNPAELSHIDAVFRAWHTVKGVAGFLNLKEIQKLAHSMESAMDRVRKGESSLNAARIDILLESNDCLKAFVNSVEEAVGGGSFAVPTTYGDLLARLQAIDLQGDAPDKTMAAPPGKKLGEILVDQGTIDREKIATALEVQKSGDPRKVGEILIAEKQVSARAVGEALAAQAPAKCGAHVEETIRVPVNRIDQLVDAIGEAVIAQSMIFAHRAIRTIEDQTINTKIGHAAMIMRQIQEMAMSLRMVSVKATFQKMARLARDLAKKCDREIDFITEGEDTELDKSVVEKIGDPLVHMVRNSVDHGIELPEEREKAGKPRKATVRLKAYHRAGNIYIEVVDDGRGLDKNAIRKKAIDKKLCTGDEHFTDEEIYRFIFLPGFSTAKQVTDISGRGVGMDVVRRNIEALRGSVEIASVQGKGTTFTIRLPLTLAIVDGMIVRAGHEHYIVPTLAILESLKPSEGQVEKIMQRGRMIKVRQDLIPLVNLATLFGKKGSVLDVGGDGDVVMIVEDMLGKKIGLQLDEIVGQQQVVIKSLGEELGEIAGVTGGAIMNDGSVSLILDIGGIAKLAQERC